MSVQNTNETDEESETPVTVDIFISSNCVKLVFRQNSLTSPLQQQTNQSDNFMILFKQAIIQQFSAWQLYDFLETNMCKTVFSVVT